MEDVSWEINGNDNTVELMLYGVVYSASVDFFNKEVCEVVGTYYNDGLQQNHEKKEINIEDENSEFSTDEIVYCFEQIPHKFIEITT